MPKKKFRVIKGHGLKKRHAQAVKQLSNQLLLKQVMAQYRACLRESSDVRDSLMHADLPRELIEEMGLCDGSLSVQLQQQKNKVDRRLLIKELRDLGILKQNPNEIKETYEGFVVFPATDQVGHILEIYRVRKAV